MWTPTHVQVTVLKARNLIAKGKGDVNDAYVMITLGQEKYMTSVKEKTCAPVWQQECDLPVQDLNSMLSLSVYHRTFLGPDQFLGCVSLNLADFPLNNCAKSRFYQLKCKPGKNDQKYRGELEVRVTFVVKSRVGSLTDVDRKVKRDRTTSVDSVRAMVSEMGEKFSNRLHRSVSFGPGSTPDLIMNKPQAAVEPQLRLPSVIAQERRWFSGLSSHHHQAPPQAAGEIFTIIPRKNGSNKTVKETFSELKRRRPVSVDVCEFGNLMGEDRSPGHEELDATPLLGILPDKDNNDIGPLSPYGGTSGLSMTTEEERLTRVERVRLCRQRDNIRRHTLQSAPSVPVSPHDYGSIVCGVGEWAEQERRLAEDRKDCEDLQIQLADKSHEELVTLIHAQLSLSKRRDRYVRDLETYIDTLLVRVMKNTPRLLQNPFDEC